MTTRNIQIEGGSLAVTLTGPTDGPLIICAPGMGDTRDAYSALTTHLTTAGYTVATVDPRGHGDSSTTFTSYGDAAMAADFLALADALSPTRPVALAGCSFSGGAAVMAAGQRPDRVAALVLLAPFVRAPAGPAVVAMMQALFWRPWGPTMWEMYAQTLWPGLGAEGAKARARRSRELTTRAGGYWTAFQRTVAGADHRVVEPWIAKVAAPVLVVMGDKDPDWSDAVKEAEWVSAQFTGSELLVVPGVGHAPMLEKPEVVASSVVKLLDQAKSQGRFEA